MILTRGAELAFEADFLDPGNPPSAFRVETLEEVERAYILKVLEAAGWRVSGKQGAAELLGLKRSTLESRMKSLGITRPL